MTNIAPTSPNTLDDRADELARLIVHRHYTDQPHLASRYGAAGREKCVEDVRHHIRYLVGAIRTGSSSLFCDYISWARSVMLVNEVDDHDFQASLRTMASVFAAELSCEEGAQAAQFVHDALDGLTQSPQEPTTALDQRDALFQQATAYLNALLAGDRMAALQIIRNEVESGVSIQDVYLHVFEPVQRELGRLWQCRNITVAQEHYCTAATQFVMSQFYSRIFAGPRNGRKLLAVCVNGELHELGMRMVADIFEMNGWDTHYLGASTPSNSIIDEVARIKPDLVAISATISSHLKDVIALIAALRADDACRDIPIVVGGRPFILVHDLWERVGADGTAANASEAVRWAQQHIVERIR